MSPALIIVIMSGPCAFPGGALKATLVDCAWLVDPHFVLVVCAALGGGLGV